MADQGAIASGEQKFMAPDGMGPGDPEKFPGSTGLLFEQAMAQTRMAVCLTDPHAPDDPIVFCNEAFERVTGYRSEEIIGRNCRFLQGADTDRAEVARMREALAQEKVVVVEIANYRKDGTRF